MNFEIPLSRRRNFSSHWQGNFQVLYVFKFKYFCEPYVSPSQAQLIVAKLENGQTVIENVWLRGSIRVRIIIAGRSRREEEKLKRVF